MKPLIRCAMAASLLMVTVSCGGEVDEVGFDDPIYFMGDDGEYFNPNPVALVAVDASRDGVVDLEDSDDLDHRFEPADGFGALFLANFDDDGGNCTDLSSDSERESCYDAAAHTVANDVDLADLARIKTLPQNGTSPTSYGILDVDDASRDKIRLYIRDGDGTDADSFSPYEPGVDKIDGQVLADGAEFAIEGRALVMDREEWDGVVELSWEVQAPDIDRTDIDQAHIELAPVLFRHHMDAAHTVYASDLGSWNADFIDDLEAAVTAADIPGGLEMMDVFDPWSQDFIETAYMAMPGPDGPQVISIYFRSANINYPGSLENVFDSYYEAQGESKPPLLREAGQVVFTDFHGSGTAGRAAYDLNKGFEPVDESGLDYDDVVRYLYGMQSDQTYPEIGNLVDRVYGADTLDSFGNTEVTPPHVAPDGTAYPHGRVYRGKSLEPGSSFRPDPTLSTLIDAQGEQPLIWLDTSWLLVAHVDETMAFVETDTERGWSMLYNDVAHGKELLEEIRDEMDGADLLMFEDLTYPNYEGGQPTPAERTVADVLDDEDIMQASARAAVEIEEQVNIMKDELGLDDEDLVPIGFLHEDAGSGVVAYQPGMVNGISLKPQEFGPPKAHGPHVDGVDLVEADLEETLTPLGVEVHWIENWDVYHVGAGEVHCASNVIRQVPSSPWWTKETE